MNAERKRDIRHFRDLDVYQRAFTVAMEIYELTEGFPSDEKYSMVDQIRRSSRSVSANLAEGWRKRRYSAVFRNKITDAMQEASETQCWLEFAYSCQYMGSEEFRRIDSEYEQIIGMLSSMQQKSDRFCY